MAHPVPGMWPPVPVPAAAPPSDADSADITKKHRAQRSRDAAREYRKRKKRDLAEMEEKLSALAVENAQLRQRLQPESTAQPKVVPAPAAVASSRSQLKDEWRRQVVEVETLMTRPNLEPDVLENAVNHVFMLGRQMLHAFKVSQVQSVDLASYATYACVGASMGPQPQLDGGAQFGAQCNAYWQELTKELELSADLRSKAETTLRDYATEIDRLTQEQSAITADLAQHIRLNMASFYVGLDAANVHPYAAKLAQLQLNFEAQWKIWERAMGDLMGCLAPMQRARVLLRKRAFLDNASSLNEMWHAVNRQPPPTVLEWEPALSALIPLPFHMCFS